jgi:regulator of chromosome condensation
MSIELYFENNSYLSDGHTTKSKSRSKTPSASSVANVSFPPFSLPLPGQVLAVGDNGMAQLGLKSAISERQNPQPVPLPELIIQIATGPLHSVCLTEKNQIYTFGCNDEHALGRIVDEDDDDDQADQFGLVDMSGIIDSSQEKIIQIVAGDSHTLVLSNLGKVYGTRKKSFVFVKKKI